jgi:phage anti-repressor protein/phage antirepressor YoqD-like protein
MSDLKIALPILSQSIGSEPVNAVNARDLHRELEIGQMFAHWIKAQIERAQLVDGVDYMLAENSKLDNQQLAQGQQKIDYIITIDAAKSVAMMSQTEKGAQVRRYFIEAEKALRNPVAALTKIDLARMLIDSEEQRIAAEERAATAQTLLEAAVTGNSQLRLEVKALEPKAAYFDATLSAKNSFPVTIIAKSLGMSAVSLNQKLKDMGIQFKVNGSWVLGSKHQNKGYAEVVTHTYENSKCQKQTSHALNWTEKGRLFIVTQLEKHC